ncbi:MAG: bifunctional 4-hydroxy-2-oxoglutarate aldolase/2-dehydro-3-deoxy-phosphogluconate aldolase [Chloroflexi bacterium]|nr:bifunctional 4-hydroxy-2-oxoglutarate aldolase/2-dehydro-3-deoxy-phosphogluconate aldolase [Chloroflexota bacterium]
MEVEERLRAAGVVLVLRPTDPTLAEAIASTLLAVGVGAIEVTFRAAGAAAAIERIRTTVPGVLVGAGTVLTRAQASEALEAGAEFVVAPGSHPDVIGAVLDAGIPMIPGVATPTEVEANLARGLTLLKLFPAEVIGGIGMLRALRGPYPGVRFVPTGGIGPANLAAYLAEPNVTACGGSWLAEGVTEPGGLSRVEELARAAAAIVASVRGPGAERRP